MLNLAPDDQGERAYEALKESVRKLDVDYVDLYLIHWPGVHGLNASNSNNSRLRDESWELMTKGVRNGLAKNIGVSNYLVRHLKELLAKDHGIKPAVNQVSFNLRQFGNYFSVGKFYRWNGTPTIIQKIS